jgi:hypothetical protein
MKLFTFGMHFFLNIFNVKKIIVNKNEKKKIQNDFDINALGSQVFYYYF